MENTQEVKILNVGDKVPAYELEAYLPAKKDFGKVNFGEIASSGKWLVLFFYPADYTFVCPTELADMGTKYEDIKKEGAEFVAISTDTHFVHMAWQKDEKLLSDITYPMAGDPAHIVSKAFGVYDEETGLSYRGTFIINPEGQITATEVNYFPVGRNSDEILRKLRAFKYVSDNPAQVCPAKWTPGEKTLTPGKDLVGNVSSQLG